MDVVTSDKTVPVKQGVALSCDNTTAKNTERVHTAVMRLFDKKAQENNQISPYTITEVRTRKCLRGKKDEKKRECTTVRRHARGEVIVSWRGRSLGVTGSRH